MSRNPSILIALLAIVVVLFGAKRLPDSARSLGKSMRIFKGEMQEMKDEAKNKDLGKASDSDKASDEK